MVLSNLGGIFIVRFCHPPLELPSTFPWRWRQNTAPCTAGFRRLKHDPTHLLNESSCGQRSFSWWAYLEIVWESNGKYMYMLAIVSTQPCHGGYLLEMVFLKVMPHIICSLLCGQTHLTPFRRFISPKETHPLTRKIYIYIHHSRGCLY